MATTRQQYVDKCNEVYDAKPAYQNGASDLNQCDCIGMTKYGLRENGVKFSTSGTNYSFRHHVENIRPINSESDLRFGDVVFKAYEQGESGWNLPAKYQQGGSEYNGDLRDYYHIGTVRSVNPLEIIHMTSPTAKCDTTLNKKGWDFVASLKKEYISDDAPEPGPGPGPEPPTPTPEKATVWADSGSTVKMRQKPSRGCSQYWDIPIGTVVDVLGLNCGSKGDWTKIGTWLKNTYAQGYMMTEFLRFEGDPEPEPQPDPDPDPQPEPGDDWVMVPRNWLLSVYNQIGELLGEG